jgi:hypothetical protein
MARSTTKRPSSSAPPVEPEHAPAVSATRKSRKQKEVPAMTQTPAEQSVAPPVPAESPASSPAEVKKTARFDIFIVDIGWHSPVADALRKNLEHCLSCTGNSTAYVLSHEQCVEFFRHHPASIGNEPSLIILDREATAANRPQGFGFKLNLGLIRDFPTASNLLKWVLAVLAEQKPGSDITEPIRTVIHKEGFRGAVDILADITRSPVGEAATH